MCQISDNVAVVASLLIRYSGQVGFDDPNSTGLSSLRVVLNPVGVALLSLLYVWIKVRPLSPNASSLLHLDPIAV